MSKHIGMIIDSSYFQSYEIKDERNNIHTYKICKICLESIDLGFRKSENSGFACTLPHICEKFKKLGAIEKFHLQLTDLRKFSPELEWGQFIFIEAK